MSTLIGNGAEQVPVNGMLGTMAFQDSNSVNIAGGNIIAGSLNVKTINGSSLLGSGDLVVGANGHNQVVVHTGNGRGSTNTAIARFTTVLTNVGTAITYADSVINGASFTINSTGLYAVAYSDVAGAGAYYFGASKNSTELTTDVNIISIASRILLTQTPYEPTPDTPYLSSTFTVVYLTSGDIVRPHVISTTGPAATNKAIFSIIKVG